MGLEAVHCDGREMRKHVCPPAIGFDEPEALGIVEPLDSTGRHLGPPFLIPRTER